MTVEIKDAYKCGWNAALSGLGAMIIRHKETKKCSPWPSDIEVFIKILKEMPDECSLTT